MSQTKKIDNYKLLLKAIGDGVFVAQDFKFVFSNDALPQLLGYTLDEFVGSTFEKILSPEHLKIWTERFSKRLEDGQEPPKQYEVKFITKLGSEIWVELRANRTIYNNRPAILGIIHDASQKKLINEELRIAHAAYLNTSEAMMITDAGNFILAVNPAFSKMSGFSEEEVVGKTPKILSSGSHPIEFYKNMWQTIKRDGSWSGEIRNRRKDGRELLESLTINTILDENGNVYRYIALFSDITERKNFEALIINHANYDQLTQLPNRRLFHDRLGQALKKSKRDNDITALLLIDLDRFKEINDTQGHDVGDILLIEAAKRIKNCVREHDTVARIGGDEFTVILTNLSDISDIGRIAQAIIMCLNVPFLLNKSKSYVSASIGISLYPEDAHDAVELIKCADQAMYQAKREGRSRFNYFTKEMQVASDSRLKLAIDLSEAMTLRQFEIYYQPIIDLANGKIVKAEALLRWKHPQHDQINPEIFIPIAEEIGLIQEIGEWLFTQTIMQIKKLTEEFRSDFQISINMSPIQFHEEQNEHKGWIKKLNELGLPGSCIVIEITEGLLIRNDEKVRMGLLNFRNAGIQVAIDDFGTGYSALSYLKKFNIDYIKIDQLFIKNLEIGVADLALCEAIVVMAHKLGLKVIAEGIETKQQWDLLYEMGCDYGQGYLFSKPVSAHEIEQYILESQRTT